MTPPRRRSTQERRIEIADAVLRLIGTRGIADLTIATVAAEVGVTSGALFRHFASRDEILEEAFRRVEELIDATFPAPDLPPLERLEKLVLLRAEAVGGNAGMARLLFSEQFQLALPEGAARRLPALVARTRSFIVEALREGISRGEIRGDVAAEDLALVVMGTIQATAFSNAILNADRPKPTRNPSGAAPHPSSQPRRSWAALATLFAPVPMPSGQRRK